MVQLFPFDSNNLGTCQFFTQFFMIRDQEVGSMGSFRNADNAVGISLFTQQTEVCNKNILETTNHDKYSSYREVTMLYYLVIACHSLQMPSASWIWSPHNF